MVTARDVSDLLEERPDLEPAIDAILEPDEPWTFDDVEIDSGSFGELVSRGLVEKSDEGYCVPDRTAIRAGLDSDVPEEPTVTNSRIELPTLDVPRLELALLVGGILLVIGFRLLSSPNVFRQGHVVLSSNDPYYYRYLVEQLLLNPDTTPSSLPSTVSKGEPLLVVTLWAITLLVGGTTDAAGHVLAWYPVGSALITALIPSDAKQLLITRIDRCRFGSSRSLLRWILDGVSNAGHRIVMTSRRPDNGHALQNMPV